RSITVPDPPML
nr:immunoglobulin heavy chain junction region [Mus musculus]